MSSKKSTRIVEAVSAGLRSQQEGTWEEPARLEPGPRPVPAVERRVPALVVIVGAVLCLGCVAVIGRLLAEVRQFTDLGDGDAVMLLRISDLVRSGLIYPDFRLPPYVVSVHGPLTYIMLGIPYAITEWLGIGPHLALRFAVLAAWCVCLALVFLISKRVNGSRGAAVATVFFAASVLLFAPMIAMRGDFIALSFSLLSAYLFVRLGNRAASPGAIVAAATALLLEPTAVAIPVGITIWFLWRRQWRDAAIWFLSIAALAAVGYALVWFREPLFAAHVAARLRPIIELETLPEIAGGPLRQLCVPFAIIGAIATVRRKVPAAVLPVILLVTTWLVAIATVLPAVGTVDAFWEPLFVSAIVAGYGFVTITHRLHASPSLVTALLTICLLRWIGPLVVGDFMELGSQLHFARNFDDRRTSWVHFSQRLAGRRLLSTDPSIAVLGSPPEVPDPLRNSIMDRTGIWSFRPVAASIAAHAYEVIVISPGQTTKHLGYRGIRIWNDEMWSTMTREYRLACTVREREVWVPRDAPADLCAALETGSARPLF